MKSAFEQLVYQEALRNLLNARIVCIPILHGPPRCDTRRVKAICWRRLLQKLNYWKSKNQIRINDADIQILQSRLQAMLNQNHPLKPMKFSEGLTPPDVATSLKTNPQLDFLNQQR